MKRFAIVTAVAASTLSAGLSNASPAPDTSPQAAQELVQQYYSNLNHGDYRAAYLAWSNGGRNSGKSFAQFKAGFAQTAKTSVVTHAPIDPDAGMMQLWITVPVDVYATLKNGTRQHFTGRYKLHATQPGVGAPPADLSWRIDSAGLAPVAH